MVSGANSDEHQAWYKADDVYKALEAVPSAEITADDVLEYCRPRLLAVAAEEALPSADRPQGEWICHEGRWIDFDYYPTKYECDQCHHYVDAASDKKYCPNCGADMRKESE